MFAGGALAGVMGQFGESSALQSMVSDMATAMQLKQIKQQMKEAAEMGAAQKMLSAINLVNKIIKSQCDALMQLF